MQNAGVCARGDDGRERVMRALGAVASDKRGFDFALESRPQRRAHRVFVRGNGDLRRLSQGGDFAFVFDRAHRVDDLRQIGERGQRAKPGAVEPPSSRGEAHDDFVDARVVAGQKIQRFGFVGFRFQRARQRLPRKLDRFVGIEHSRGRGRAYAPPVPTLGGGVFGATQKNQARDFAALRAQNQSRLRLGKSGQIQKARILPERALGFGFRFFARDHNRDAVAHSLRQRRASPRRRRCRCGVRCSRRHRKIAPPPTKKKRDKSSGSNRPGVNEKAPAATKPQYTPIIDFLWTAMFLRRKAKIEQNHKKRGRQRQQMNRARSPRGGFRK